MQREAPILYSPAPEDGAFRISSPASPAGPGRGLELDELVSQLLKRDIEIIEAGRNGKWNASEQHFPGMLALLVSLFLWLVRGARMRARRKFPGYRLVTCAGDKSARSRRKTQWGRRAVIRLKALMRRAGTCRAIAALFNRRFAEARRITVGRTFVSEVIRTHRYAIEIERRRLKNRKPRFVPRNLVWAVDLTGKTDAGGRLHSVMGLIDHGTRGLLQLIALADKSSWTLLGQLFPAIGRFGKPGALRTGNERVFTSRVFRLALFLLGIRHQRTEPHCPWQNGRIERLFGTLKASLDLLAVDSLEALNRALGEFRFFYNHVRPHQNLAGRTPAEAWAGIDPFATQFRDEFWFEAWEGLLCGYYFRR